MPGNLLPFPNPVNETASRVVAGGVAVIAASAILTQQPWLSAVLAYGFLARVATGPTLSPLGQLATKMVAPRLSSRPKLVAGPPKRFAQGIGAVITVSATLLTLLWHADLATYILLAVLLVAATLESAFAFCVGCRIFTVLMRVGLIPPEVCVACSNLSAYRAPGK